MTPVLMPQLSLAMEEGAVVRWYVASGERVQAGQTIVEIESDKATTDVEAPVDGILQILVEEGERVAVNAPLAEIGARTAADSAAAPAPRPAEPIASPVARRIARERGIDLGAVVGTGPGGRIVAADVERFPRAPAPAAAERTDQRSDLREAVVAALRAGWREIPHIHVGGELQVDRLVRARTALSGRTPRVTLTDLLIVAVSRALGEVPELNALRRPDGTVVHARGVDLALAVATPQGVVAPVLRDASSRPLPDVAAERARLVAAARSGGLDRRELGGATCTLSNLGAYPVDFFAPVLSGPQVAVVATGRVAERPVAEDGRLGVRTLMWVNVAVDHRAADGEAAGRFLRELERAIGSLDVEEGP